MKRQLIKLVTVGGVAAGMFFAQAQTTPAQPNQEKSGQSSQEWREHRKMAREHMMAELNLSPEQKAKAKQIFAKAREESRPVREELWKNRQAMNAAVKANDKGQIAKVAEEHGKLRAKLVTIRAEARAQFYQELTPQQKAKSDEMRARAEARMRERMQQRNSRTE